ncbi:MAG: sensor histidine kinase [Candidatus Acidulodesulfobacterium ferriphilum]|uniref:histidine kinase n=1 Tax=Candidatus Acidulodesulfobacterium ferriphilum TaxID=2597223 RepID=A0A519BC86_9DELT|nr:MAG: sensor histidine kinase [Candidatus Acidulodesulfobacterium ferriphilum]
MEHFIKNLSIKWKILISAFAIFFFTIFLSDAVFLYTIYKTLSGRHYLKNTRIARILISEIKYSLYFNKIRFLKKYLKSNIKNYRIIKGISIYNPEGKLIMNSGKLYAAHNPVNDKKKDGSVLIRNIDYGGKILGLVAIKFNLKKEIEATNNRVFWVGVRFSLIALIFIALGLFMFYIITVIITKPLLEIKENIEKIKNGDYKISFTKRLNDEIGSVISAISSMALSIEDYTKKIDLVNKEKNELNCMAIMGEMSANIAHEVKNAIYIISSANAYISHETRNKIVLEVTNIINNEVKRLDKMTVDFLSFSRQRNPELVPVNINRLIDDSVRILKLEIDNLNIKLIKEFQEDLPVIKGDPELLKQVILNLIINAMDKTYNAGNKIIEIKTVLRGDFINIEIIDNGEVIPEENIEKILKPFFTTKKNGSGLGLPISMRIIKLHGGTINVYSKDNKTAFVLVIPKAVGSGIVK